MINVTKTYLPDIEKYQSYVKQIFESGWLTNNGRLIQELEGRLERYLGVKNLLLVANGTLALQVAYKLLNLKGEVLTTPFSFVATTSSIVWEGLEPVFVDIHPDTLNIHPDLIEGKITNRTSAIVATHVYGNSCDIERIQTIARRHNLKVIYDAAHAFGVNYKGRSILDYGDISAISFHSTKLFHTIEGGALVINDDDLYEKAKKIINFGIISPTEITELGINAKMNEFQAAMGLCVLDDISKIMEQRKEREKIYMSAFNSIPGLQLQARTPSSTNNYSHFPIILPNEQMVEDLISELNRQGINPRRYFYPSLETLPYLSTRQYVPIANDVSRRVLCLPMYGSLEEDIQKNIVDIVLSNIVYKI